MSSRFCSYTLAAAATFVALLPPVSVDGALLGLDLHQASFDLGDQSQPFSDWGEASVTFEGKSNFQYFNLVRDGNWVIENAPIVSIEGPGLSQSLSINFNLGNTPGDPTT